MNTNTGIVKTAKESRRPFGSQTQKLHYPARAGYHRHWFRDDPGRVEEALAAGYKHVEDRDGKKVVRVGGVTAGGGPMMMYLMEIPEEWYQEDMAKQQERVDETDRAIRRGAIAGSPGVDGRYVKSINIKDGHG